MYTISDTKNLQALSDSLLKNNENSVDQLRVVLRFHEYRYYILNDPLVSDSEYDQLYKKLEKLEKENPSIITADSPTQRVDSANGSSLL